MEEPLPPPLVKALPPVVAEGLGREEGVDPTCCCKLMEANKDTVLRALVVPVGWDVMEALALRVPPPPPPGGERVGEEVAVPPVEALPPSGGVGEEEAMGEGVLPPAAPGETEVEADVRG